MATNRSTSISESKYLALDNAAERASEYLCGQMVPIEDATQNHSIIVVNLITNITNSLRSKNSECQGYAQPLRVHMPRTGLSAYPDFIIACGQPIFEAYDTLLNPTLIVEVLSPSTAGYDLGIKLDSYRSIASCEEYWTVARDKLHIHQWKLVNHQWTLTEHTTLDAVVPHPKVEITLADIYRNVRF